MGRSVVALQCFPSSVRRKREEAYHKLPVRARGTGDVGSFSPYFMLLFDSVGHYFRLRREMLSGSRFTPRSPSRFFLCSPPPPVLFLSLSPFNFPLPASHPRTDSPNREKYVEFPGQPHERSNATPVFEPRFRSS